MTGVQTCALPILEHQVEWSGPRAMAESSPILRGVTPETPNFRSPRGDLEPMMANEEEVVRSLIQLVKAALEGDVPMKNIAEDFRWELGHV